MSHKDKVSEIVNSFNLLEDDTDVLISALTSYITEVTEKGINKELMKSDLEIAVLKSRIEMLEDSITEECNKARIKTHREYKGYTDDFKDISEYAERRIAELQSKEKE